MELENKVPEQINDIKKENFEKLAQLFPSIIKDGQVDFKALKEELGEFEEVKEERYEFTWAGKQNAKKKVQEDVGARTLKYIEEDSKNSDTTENLYIEGDNLEVLKLLRQNYYGSIKMIYIDPPYNTGEDFIYNDDFKISRKESEKNQGYINEDNEKLQKNIKDSNRFHANWLNMMYPRLRIAKDLLTDDGVIFISIDDNEINSTLNLVNELYEEKNVKVISVKMSEASGLKMGAVKKQGTIPKLKEYIVIIRKNGIRNFKFENINKEKWDTEYNIFLENFTKEDKRKIDEINESKEVTIEKIKILDEIAKKVKLVSVSEKIKELKIINDEKENWLYSNSYRICQCATSASVLALANEKKEYCNSELFFVSSKNNEIAYFVRGNYSKESSKPRLQLIFAEDNLTQHPGDIWTDIKTTGLDNEGGVPFKNGKKPIKLLTRLINSVELEKNEKNYILDFFSGSGSTAEAVMQLNKNLNFIMVQIRENLEESLLKATGDNKKSLQQSIDFLKGIKKDLYITEIGKERIRRAGETIKEKIEKENLKLGEEPKKVPDIGFKVFRTADTNINWKKIREVSKDNVMKFDDPDMLDFTLGFNDKDVVYEVLLRQRDLPLSEKLVTLTDIGSRTYLYANSYLVCLETNVTEELIEKLAELNPLPIKFIFRDSAFGSKIGLKEETFRKLKTLVEKNSGLTKKAYTVEFI